MGFNFGPPFDYPKTTGTEFFLLGDIDNDGWSDIAERVPWGLNIFSYSVPSGAAGNWKGLFSMPQGTRLRSVSSSIGHWALGAGDRIEAVGNFDGVDNGYEFVIRSDWGMGVLDYQSGQLVPLATLRHSTAIPGISPSSSPWTFDSNARVLAVGNFDSATTRDELLVASANGLAVLRLTDSGMRTVHSLQVGSRIPGDSPRVGNWAVNRSDHVLAWGDIDGILGDEFVIESNWGLSIITVTSRGFRAIETIRRGSNIDGFTYTGALQAAVVKSGTRNRLILGTTDFSEAPLIHIRLAEFEFLDGALNRVATAIINDEAVLFGGTLASNWHIVATPNLDGDTTDELIIATTNGFWRVMRLREGAMVEIYDLRDLGSYIGDWQFSLWDGVISGKTPGSRNSVSLGSSRSGIMIIKPALAERYER